MMKARRSAGFSLAEMMIVVAIIVILAGVAFVGVQSYQRSSTRLEFDTLAKEIFFAAQNHLTEAQGQGLLDELSGGTIGTPGTWEKDKINNNQEVYYLLSSDASSAYVLGLMLPQYSVDEFVLAGSFLIRYQPSAGRVLDVFYSRPGTPTFLTSAGTRLGENGYTYEALMNGCRGDNKTKARQRFGSNNAVVGWYGNEEAIERGMRLKRPTFEISNAEILEVVVRDTNAAPPDGYKIKLIVTGKTSKAEKYFDLMAADDPHAARITKDVEGAYHIVLDDITKASMHFEDLIDVNSQFIPGEDLEIKAVSFSTGALANVAMSTAKVTNSLFDDPKEVKAEGTDIDSGFVSVGNFRHLENLDGSISALGDNTSAFAISRAAQTQDLSWSEFKQKTGGDRVYNKDNQSANEGCCLPVTPRYYNEIAYTLSYEGNNHRVSDVKIEFAGPAGMFGILIEGSRVKDLELLNFSVKGTSYAGALAGWMLEGCTVTNVLARNSDNRGELLDKRITATQGADGPWGGLTDGTVQNNLLSPETTPPDTCAGGLVGKMETGTMVGCAAAVIVGGGASNPTYAGGLVGIAEKGVISGCYAGGHTLKGHYEEWLKAHHLYDVTAGTAGGFAGRSSAAISNSYTTCSVSGVTAGGFAGEATGSITGSYATGLVAGSGARYAFLASGTANLSGNWYFESINKDEEKKALLPVAGYELTSANMDKVKPLDLNAATYNTFVGAWESWGPAEVYDDALYNWYNGRYTLRTVDELGTVTLPDDYVSWADFKVTTHYGDWPSPEAFLINN